MYHFASIGSNNSLIPFHMYKKGLYVENRLIVTVHQNIKQLSHFQIGRRNTFINKTVK